MNSERLLEQHGNVFICPNCYKQSKIRIPTDPSNTSQFLITCFFCKNKTRVKFIQKSPEPLQKENNILVLKRKISLPKFSFPWRESLDRVIQKFQRSKLKKEIYKNEKIQKKISFFSPLLISLFLILFIVMFFIFRIFIQTNQLEHYLVELSKNSSIKIYDRNKKFLSELFEKKKSNLEFSEIPENLIKIIISIEDRRFYKHHGIDFLAIFRAILINISNFGYKQGGSSITQQLARILLDDREKTLIRKWKEAELALSMELKLSKEEILTYYINNVYLGHGSIGFQSASSFYFKKKIKDLTNPEMILLASLASAPNRYSPIKNPKLSRARVSHIISSMKKNGTIKKDYLSEFDNIYKNFLIRSPNETVFGNRVDNAPYLSQYVLKFLSKIFPNKNINEMGGIVVETTIENKIQKKLDQIVNSTIRKLYSNKIISKKISHSSEEEIIKNKFLEFYPGLSLFANFEDLLPKGNDRLQTAIVGLNPINGEILFFLGGDAFQSSNQFNRAFEMRRQTGSTIKPILYSAAIDSNVFLANSVVLDAPLLYENNTANGWTPENIGGKYEGEMSIREAMAKSKNSAAVQVGEKLGNQTLKKYFLKFFNFKDMESRYKDDLSIALGSIDFTPLEMARAYSVFVNDGFSISPFLIKTILDQNGNLIYEGKENNEFYFKNTDRQKVISSETASILLSFLEDSAKNSLVRKSGYKGFVAGKTGTTNNYRDAWFVGVKSGLSMSIWFGFDNQKSSMGSNATGSNVSSEIWGEIAKFLSEEKIINESKIKFSRYPISKTICKESFKLKNENCPTTREEFFKSDNLPKEVCPLAHSKDPNQSESML